MDLLGKLGTRPPSCTTPRQPTMYVQQFVSLKSYLTSKTDLVYFLLKTRPVCNKFPNLWNRSPWFTKFLGKQFPEQKKECILQSIHSIIDEIISRLIMAHYTSPCYFSYHYSCEHGSIRGNSNRVRLWHSCEHKFGISVSNFALT